MGSGEAVTPAKAPKASSAQPSAPAGYHPEWAAFQAYYPGGTPPPGYFPPSAGPQPHPYMWSAQMMPYVYPPHYGMPPAATTETDGKSSDGKEKSPLKRSKGATKATERAKSGSANGVVSQSGESASDGSSEGSDEDQNGTEKRNSEQMNAEGANAGQQGYSGNNAAVAPGGKTPVGTTLNMGMDYWGGQPAGNPSSGKGKRNAQAMAAGMPSGQLIPAPGRDGVPPEIWLQDERELKRQRRKQSNRESARRSRLRKQAECEELAQRVDSLTVENMSLRQELEQVIEERNKLMADNAALAEQLQKSGRQSNEADIANNNTDEASEQGEEKDDAPAAEMNGRVEGENCETVGKAALEAAAAAAAAASTNRSEAVAAAG